MTHTSRHLKTAADKATARWHNFWKEAKYILAVSKCAYEKHQYRRARRRFLRSTERLED